MDWLVRFSTVKSATKVIPNSVPPIRKKDSARNGYVSHSRMRRASLIWFEGEP